MLINLILWEKKNGLKAKYVSEKLGLTESTYSRIKNGKQVATIDIAFKFLDEFKDIIPDQNVLKLFEHEEICNQ